MQEEKLYKNWKGQHGDKKEIIRNGKEDEKSKHKASQADNYSFSRYKQGLDSICQSVPISTMHGWITSLSGRL